MCRSTNQRQVYFWLDSWHCQSEFNLQNKLLQRAFPGEEFLVRRIPGREKQVTGSTPGLLRMQGICMNCIQFCIQRNITSHIKLFILLFFEENNIMSRHSISVLFYIFEHEKRCGDIYWHLLINNTYLFGLGNGPLPVVKRTRVKWLDIAISRG